MRYLITIEYDGTSYCGWQIQKNGISIQQVVEDCFFEIFSEKIRLFSSGRTDAGVHAIGQTAHFDLETPRKPDSIVFALNSYLPKNISIKNCSEVPQDFHARYSVISKTYLYKVYNSRIRQPLKENRACQVKQDLNVEKMRQAIDFLVGERDFIAFMASGSKVKDTVRNLFEIKIFQNGSDIDFYFTGNGFLYNMVRILVGTLVDVGLGKKTTADIEKIFAEKDRSLAGKTLSACGLYLFEVKYR